MPDALALGGRPPHEPTDIARDTAKKLSGLGVNHDDIAKILRISDETLRKYYADELLMGKVEANSEVASSLFRNATKNENVSAQIFWLKTQARWKEQKDDDDPVAPPRIVVTGGLPTG